MRKNALVALIALGIFGCGESAAQNTGQATSRQNADCARAVCRTGKFAFINFTGERVAFYVGNTLVVDEILETRDWSTAISRYVEYPIGDATHLKLIIDGAVRYEGQVSGSDVLTIYIDARPPSVSQTNHPGPLLD